MLTAALLLCLQVQDLDSADPAVRNAAGEALIKKGAAAVPDLIPLLESGDAERSGRAVELIRRIGLPAAPILEEAPTTLRRDLARRLYAEKAAQFLKESEAYDVRWGEPQVWTGPVELNVGNGSGHGGLLRWIRLRPGPDSVEVLTIEYQGSRKPYDTPWPPDEAPVTVAVTSLGLREYSTLLRVLGCLAAATVERTPARTFFSSSADFYAYVRASTEDRALFEDEYAGYLGTLNASTYARVKAAGELITEVLKLATPLPPEKLDRAWVTGRFLRDWARIAPHKDFYWWVKERLLIVVGALGDASALPVLRDVIRDGDVKARTTYHAINAATRLLGTDVRGSDVQRMDVDAVRKKLLPLLEKQ